MREVVIQTVNLAKYYDDLVVKGLTFAVPRGSVYALLGRNGAGKTTTLNMVLGLLDSSYGESYVFGENSTSLSPETKGRISFVDEGQSLYGWMKVSEIIRYTASFYRGWSREVCDRMLDMFEIDTAKRIGILSPGERSKLALTLAISPGPELLVLDDISAKLDTVARRQFIQSIIRVMQKEGRTVLFSSHILTEVERIADHVGIIDKGILKVDSQIDELKATVKKVRLQFEGEVPPIKGIDNIIRVTRDDHSLSITVSDYSEDLLAKFRSYNPRELDVVDLTLEDIFIEFVSKEKEVSNVL